MHGIILAAGRGSRMGKLTTETPKCLTYLNQRTLLSWQLEALRDAGVDNVVIITGYRSELIDALGNCTRKHHGWSQTNMVGSLMAAKDLMGQHDVVVSYSDIVYHPECVKELIQSSAGIGIVYDIAWDQLWDLRFDDVLRDAETFKVNEGLLTEIGGQASSRTCIEGQYMGLIRFSPSGWGEFVATYSELSPDEQETVDMTSMLGKLLKRGSKIEARPICGRWCEVDTEKDQMIYERCLQKNQSGAWLHDWRWER